MQVSVYQGASQALATELTQRQVELSHVAIISAYTCLPAFIFWVALKCRHPRVLCSAVHLEPEHVLSGFISSKKYDSNLHDTDRAMLGLFVLGG